MLIVLLPSLKEAFNLFLEWSLRFLAWAYGRRGLQSGSLTLQHHQETCWSYFFCSNAPLSHHSHPLNMLFHLPGTFFPWAICRNQFKGHFLGEVLPKPQGRPLRFLSHLYFLGHCNLSQQIVGSKRAGITFLLFITLGRVLSGQPACTVCLTCWLNKWKKRKKKQTYAIYIKDRRKYKRSTHLWFQSLSLFYTQVCNVSL